MLQFMPSQPSSHSHRSPSRIARCSFPREREPHTRVSGQRMGRADKILSRIGAERTRFDAVDAAKAIGTGTLAVERVTFGILATGEGGEETVEAGAQRRECQSLRDDRSTTGQERQTMVDSPLDDHPSGPVARARLRHQDMTMSSFGMPRQRLTAQAPPGQRRTLTAMPC